MRNSCVVCSLAVALCLVVCVSANAKVTQADATTAVDDAQRTVKTVHGTAQTQFDNAKGLLDKVKSSKSAADEAASKSYAEAKDNEEAKKIAAKIESLSDEVAASYLEVKEKLEEAVKSLTSLLAEAQTLEGKREIEITPNGDQGDDFTGTKDRATALKGDADDLNQRITAAVQPISGFDSKADDMVKKAKEAQLKDAHVSVIVAVSKIGTILENAATTIGKIEGKKNEVSGIVGEMQTLHTNNPTVSDENINALLQNADNALKSAKNALGNANSAKADIQTQKDTADAALTKVKAENQEVSQAKQEVQKAEECVAAAQLIVTQLNDALQTAVTSVTNAKASKQKLIKALSTTTTAPSTVQATETETANPPVGQGTEHHQKDTTIQPMSKELPIQSNNSADKQKDALIKGAQNVPTTALTGRKAPAPGAKNDSAMTVSVPLLVALIASAVLQ